MKQFPMLPAFALAVVLSWVGQANAQTSLTVPISPPAPTSFQVQVNQSITLNGVAYSVVGTLTLTPTASSSGGATTDTSTGSAATGSSTSASIAGVVSSSGTGITMAAGGAVIAIQGANLGQFGTVTVAGLAATPKAWTPTLVTVTLPTTGSAASSVTGPIVLTVGGGGPVVTSSFAFTITGLTASTDTGAPTAAGSSTILATSQTVNDPPIPTPVMEDLYKDYVPVAEDPGLIPGPGPVLFGVLDSTGQPVTTSINLDQIVTLDGSGFGHGGELQLDGKPVDLVSWEENRIVARTLLGGQTDQLAIYLRLDSGSYYLGGVDLRPEPAVAGEQ